MTRTWTGPWVVDRRVAPALYRTQPYDPSSPHPPLTVHMGRLKKFMLDRILPAPPAETDPGPQEEQISNNQQTRDKLPDGERKHLTRQGQISTLACSKDLRFKMYIKANI
ncbi:MAG: hypothetical protein GY696_01375 [Gammaproteobacteria bacterium]|nr:hypothetical protein [Gammaproteobacteria bacterium]